MHTIERMLLIAAAMLLLAGCRPREPELVMPKAARLAQREQALLAQAINAATTGPPQQVITVVVERVVEKTISAPTPVTLPSPAPVMTSNVIAIVGDEVLTIDDFRRSIPGPALEQMPEYLRREMRALLEQMINNRVLAYAAKQHDYSANTAYQRDVANAITQVKMRYFFDEKTAEIAKLTDADIEKYYREHEKEFIVPERIRARHILIELKPAALPAEVSNAYARAQALRRRVMEGEPFATVAAQESSCPSRTRGGDLDYFTRGQMDPAFEAAAFALERNEISDIVKTQFGYHIIQLTDRIPPWRCALDEARNEIRTQLEQQRERALYDGMLTSLTNTYKVIRNEKLIQDLVHNRL
jgi:peptidyl-prolyl cis-trans isomerase C